MAKDDEIDPVVARVLENAAHQPIIPDRTLDPRTTGFLGESIRTTIDTISGNAAADGDIGRKMAKVCLVVEEDPGMWDWIGSIFSDDDSGDRRLTVIAYVPRVHSMVPDPIRLAASRGYWPEDTSDEGVAKYEALVHSLLTDSSAKFILGPQFNDVQPQPGSWVWVEYTDEVNKTDGVLTSIAVVSNIPEGTRDALGSARGAFEGGSRPSTAGGRPLGSVGDRTSAVQLSRPGSSLDESAPPASESVHWLIGAKARLPARTRFHVVRKKKDGSGETRLHNGIDVYAKEGSQVFSVTSGKVTSSQSISGYGLTVVIYNEELGQEFLYAHLSKKVLAKGAMVEEGQLVGYVGRTAHYKAGSKKARGGDGQFFNDDPAHLHFEVLKSSGNINKYRTREDPQAWLRENGKNLSEGVPA